MKLVKKTPEYSIFQRGDERYAVQDAKHKAVNGEEKVSILTAEGLVKASVPKPAPVEEAPAEEVPVEEPAADEPAAEVADEPAAEVADEVVAEADAGTEPQA